MEGSTRRLIIDKVSLLDAFKFLVDNSIEAYKKKYKTIYGCNVYIRIKNDEIYILDNAGGIISEDSYKKLFSINEGTGLKKACYKLADNVILESNNKNKHFIAKLDYNYLNVESKEYIYEEKEFDNGLGEIFSIKIDKINSTVKSEIMDQKFILNLKNTLEKFYRVYIKKGLSIKINTYTLEEFIPGLLLERIDIENGYINIYKTYDGEEGKRNGIDLFIDDWLIIDRKKDSESGWTRLKTKGYTFKDRIIEVVYNPIEDENVESIKENIYERFFINIKEHMDLFLKETVTISFEADKKKVLEMMDEFNCEYYKDLGEHAFIRLENEFKERIKEKNKKN